MFENESELEKHIRELLNRALAGDARFMLLRSKKVADIVVCREGSSPAIFFIEVKLCKANMRTGIGSPGGKGFQPEIVQRRPKYLEDHMLWLLCDQEKGLYVVADTEVISKYPVGSSIGPKQNNISPRILKEKELLGEDDLVNEVLAFLNQE